MWYGLCFVNVVFLKSQKENIGELKYPINVHRQELSEYVEITRSHPEFFSLP